MTCDMKDESIIKPEEICCGESLSFTSFSDDHGLKVAKHSEQGSKLRNIKNEQRMHATTTPTMGYRWSSVSERLKQMILYLVKAVACSSARNPGKVIVSLTITSITMIIFGFATNFRLAVHNNELFTPFSSLTEIHQDWIANKSNFTAVPRDTHITVNLGGKNVLGVEGLSRVFQIVDTITDMEKYHQICFSDKAKHCKLNSVIDFWPNNTSLLELMEEIPINDEEAIGVMSSIKYPNGATVYREQMFGKSEPLIRFENVSYSREDVRLQSAQAYHIYVSYPNGGKEVNDFEKDLSDALTRLRKEWSNDDSDWCLEYLVIDSSLETEMKRAIDEDIILLFFAFVMMFALCAIYFAKRDMVRSRSILGFGAVLSVLLSLMATFGSLFCIGVPFTQLSLLLPFILAGIGMDDAFIITGAFSRTDPNMEVAKRVSKTMDEIGMSIFLSTTTTFLAFVLSSTSTIPAVRWFCFYAAPCVMVDFLFQISFFISYLVYDQRRIDANRVDILCCFKKRKPPESHENEGPKKKAWSTGEFMTGYVNILLQPVTKVAVLLIFAIILMIGILSALKMEQYFDITMLVPTDSFVKDYFTAQDKYTRSSIFNTDIYFRGIDFSTEKNRRHMQLHIKTLVDECEFITYSPDFFWVDDFEKFILSNYTNKNIQGLDFNDQIEEFLSTPPYDYIYISDFARNEVGNITSSKVSLSFRHLDRSDITSQIVAFSHLRDVARNSPLNKDKDKHESSVFSYSSFYFSWEFSSIVLKELQNTAIFALISVFILSFIFIPHPSGSLFVTSMVAVIFVELVGLLRFGGVHINVFTSIMLVMAIGLSVDFVMHIVHAYYETSAPTREAKVHTVMMTMGSSLLVAGCSTLFGTMLLVFGSSTMCYITFLTFVGVVSLGVSHSLILIPVLLSLIGPLYNPKDPSFQLTSPSNTNI